MTEITTTTTPRTHTGSCHCGRVRFETTATLDSGMTCNCSICSRMGWVLVFVPSTSFTLLDGADALTDYQFGKKHLHHPFCSTCGVHAFSRGFAKDGTETFSVNVRCLEDIDVTTVPTTSFDGKSL